MAKSKIKSLAGIEPGIVQPFAGDVVPNGFLLCDGSAISRTTYANLFTAIGVAHGEGDGTSTFNLPDYRGIFLRGVDGTANRDPDKASRTAAATGGNTGDNVGSVQGDQVVLHGHPFRLGSEQGDNGTTGGFVTDATGVANYAAWTGVPSSTAGQQIGGAGGSETRPKNANVNYIISY